MSIRRKNEIPENGENVVNYLKRQEMLKKAERAEEELKITLQEDKKRKEEIKSKYGKEYWKWIYLYLIKCDNFYKIGSTFNLENRLNSLQCGNPYLLEIVYSIKHPEAEELEIFLQEQFKDKKHFREWFKLDDEDINVLKEFVENSWQKYGE